MIIFSCLVCGVFVVVVGSLATSSAFGVFSLNIDQRLEKACHKAITRRVPSGHRDIETISYDLNEKGIGIAEGVLEAKFDQSKWAKIAWTCKVNPRSAAVIHSEVRFANVGRKIQF